jgi:hypothetical protein
MAPLVRVPFPGSSGGSNPNAGHPGNDYYVNILTHTIQRQGNSILGDLLHGTGWLGPFDWSTAKQTASGLAAAAPATPGSLPGGGGSSSNSGSSTASGSEWQHLLVRIAEFVIGAALVVVGIQAVVVKSKPGQTIIQTTAGVARVVK